MYHFPFLLLTKLDIFTPAFSLLIRVFGCYAFPSHLLFSSMFLLHTISFRFMLSRTRQPSQLTRYAVSWKEFAGSIISMNASEKKIYRLCTPPPNKVNSSFMSISGPKHCTSNKSARIQMRWNSGALDWYTQTWLGPPFPSGACRHLADSAITRFPLNSPVFRQWDSCPRRNAWE